MSNSDTVNHGYEEMAKGLNTVECTLQNLKQLLAPGFLPLLIHERAKILALTDDLNSLRLFLKRVLEISVNHTTVTDLSTDILSVVDELSVANKSYVLSNVKNFDTECFLEHSSKVADLVKKIQSVEAMNHFREEMAKALNIVEFTLENLDQLLASGFLRLLIHGREKLLSFREDLKSLRSLLKRVQEISVDHTITNDFLTDVFLVVDELLVATNSYAHSNDIECFLKHSSQVSDLVGKIQIQSIEGIIHCHDKKTKALNIVDFTMDNLERLLVRGSRHLLTHKAEIFVLKGDLNSLRSFLKRLQEIPVDHRKVTDLITNIVAVVAELLVVTNSYIRSNVEIFDIECFLKHSSKVAGLVRKIQNVEGINHFHSEMAKALNIIEFTLEDLELLLGHESISLIRLRAKISSLHEQVNCLRLFLKRMQEIQLDHSNIADFVSEIVLVVDGLLVATDSYVLGNIIKTDNMFDTECFLNHSSSFDHRKWTKSFLKHSSKVDDLVGKIQSVEAGMISKVYSGHISDEQGKCYAASSSSQIASSIVEEKIIVGFEEEAKQLLDRLIAGRKQLEVIPIIGMAGIGKTTFANQLFNSTPIVAHFHVRAWTSVSQFYQKRKLLCDILSSIVNENDPVFAMNEEDLGEKLYKCLKGNRYLIVIDDIWDIGVWNDFEMYFPKDEDGSRILVTSRIEDVASTIRLGGAPCFLPFLSQDESRHLFQYTIFAHQNIPEELVEIREQIIAKCKGLPLAIVVVAGLLAKEEKSRALWSQVAENIGGSINNDLEQLMSTLALSYKHLSSSLKSCFLYLASFPEDYEIPVRRLIRLWISEGFIQKTADKSLEDVAKDYLRNLVSRSLLIIAKKRSDGGIKSCRIHDLLRDLCKTKAEEKRFVQLVCKCGSNATLFRPKRVLPNSSTSKDDPLVPSFLDCQYFSIFITHILLVNMRYFQERLYQYTNLFGFWI